MYVRTGLPDWVPYAVYNTAMHTTTSFTPFELVYGFRSEVPSALRVAPTTQYNYEGYLTGRSKKLSPQYIGPYEVVQVERVNVIKRGRSAQKVHINRIRPFY
jgi:hypothetical protein